MENTIQQVMDQIRAHEAVVRVFPDWAALEAWMDEFDAACTAAELPMEVAVEAVHCTVVVFHPDHRPAEPELTRLMEEGTRQFHDAYGRGECGLTHTTKGTR